MKTSGVLEKEFVDSADLWDFLDRVTAQARRLPDPDFRIEVDGLRLRIVLPDRASPLLRLLQEAEARPKTPARLFCDGGSRGNPGPGACGFAILDADDRSLEEGGEFFARCTNNYAEYMGLKEGVAAALRRGIEHLDIYMDSQLIVKQIKGEYKIKHKDLLPIYQAVKSDLAGFKSYKITFIPRSHNKLADSLVNRILDRNT